MNPGCVEVQAVRLDGTSMAAREHLLSPDEVIRAGRFRSERDRARFVEARGFLQVLLGQALGAPGRCRAGLRRARVRPGPGLT